MIVVKKHLRKGKVVRSHARKGKPVGGIKHRKGISKLLTKKAELHNSVMDSIKSKPESKLFSPEYFAHKGKVKAAKKESDSFKKETRKFLPRKQKKAFLNFQVNTVKNKPHGKRKFSTRSYSRNLSGQKGKYRFRVKSANGEKLGDNYSSPSATKKGVAALQEALSNPKLKFKIIKTPKIVKK